LLLHPRPPTPPLFPYTTLFRSLPYTNHRTDEYGGSFENRYRFAVEVVEAIKKACGENYPVSLRYSVVSKTKGLCKGAVPGEEYEDRKSTRLNSSHVSISYAVFC